MMRKSPYDYCTSKLIQRGETLFPFSSFVERVDWLGVGLWLDGQEWDGDE